MPEWLIERGIGETRAVLVEAGELIEARIYLEGVPRAGSSLQAVLKRTGTPAIAIDGDQEYVLPKGAPGATEGQTIAIEISRERIPGAEPWKRPLARLAGSAADKPLEGEMVPFPDPRDRLAEAGWWDLVDEARTGIVQFAGGELRISPTPAMTLIDVDGALPSFDLALAGAAAAAKAVRRHGIGGSIGVDLPTVGGRAQRQKIAELFDAILPQPFERTGVNGFGFIQIIRPRRHASLFELALDRAPFEARALLRRAAMELRGPRAIVAHPAVIAVLDSKAGWLETLSRQLGGAVSLRGDPKLPISAGHAEPI